jgi:hypothetical protein
MAYNYNPSSSGGKDHKSAVQGQPGNNLARPNLNNEPGMIYTSIISATWEALGRRIKV